ncbi:hypothetical protein [Pedobacter caeni]|uniref:DUF4440 domain-containing protein n=1 Tax=Pedobacter caeni TaxID=288992 RepID=A0A1M5JSX7_9SPHI|nr:hypothetical protein [Pedobacter caeni]SHG43646.1 hypothetical protein SAMN04488522_105499 [Pedobacter caeni]
MKTLFFTALVLLSFSVKSRAQQQDPHTRKELEKVIEDFRTSIIEKDSVKFYTLFHQAPVVWIGVDKEKSQRHFKSKNKNYKSNFFSDSPQGFIRRIVTEKEPEEEKFYDIKIEGDERIASITFSYSYWRSGEKQNWGKESWALIRANGLWKITAVLFSSEMENVTSEPKSN